MKKIIASLFMFPLVAMAQVSVPDYSFENISALIPNLLTAIAEGKWVIVGAILVLVATLVFRQIVLPKLTVSTKILPWIVAVLSLLNGIAAIVIGGMPVKQAAVMVLVSGGLASQLWELGGKKLSEWLLSFFGKELGK